MNNDEIISRNDENDSYSEVVGSEEYYTSGKVAEMLGLSRDMVRHYTNEYSEFLSTEKTKDGKGGHLRYKDVDISNLKMILNLLKVYSSHEVKSMMRDPEVKIVLENADNPDARMTKLLIENNKYLLKMFQDYMEKQLDQTRRLEDNKAKEELILIEKQYEELKSENEEMKALLHQALDKLDALGKKPEKSKWSWFRRQE